MPEPDEANQPDETAKPDGSPRPSVDRDADAGPPKAIPRPSAASRDRPVPKPVRPRRSARGPAQVEARPAGVLPEQKPRPVTGPELEARGGTAGGVGGPGAEARSAQGRLSETCDEAQNADQRERPSSGVVTRTTRPGITQAAKLGSDKAGTKREFTTHLHRDQDRVNIRDFIDVSYRFVLPNRPEFARNVYNGRLVDISLTGAQVEGPVPEGVPSDELTSDKVVVKSEMALPYVEGPLVADSQLAWVRPGRVAGCSLGLSFIDVTDDQLKLIRGFLIGLQSPTRTKFRRGR